ncbi:T9SS type A sorting domain-containing protein [Sabulilitoribacter multivorans]|uniref:T9SS type A sorting domain-containing protein n=1 Tax=Flaviramulus multivorans TaxID=1304750 RepID=A0ABS9IHJ9_9FLAO|nr:T9SS type A sorting domain-containing protein [Flaviramulus multivorans]MCF7559895.1 T9SS type A sorting domain-containing protein [Flaviramulus multivorans]
MKKLYFLLFLSLFTSLSFSQTTIFQESFETGNSGTTSEDCNDNGGDFFTRTDGSDVAGYNVTGADGTFYFAAQDTDGAPCTMAIETLTFSGINISTYSNMTFAVLVAEDDSSDGFEDWDANTSVVIEINIDGGGYTNLIQFSSGGATNTEPGLDTNFDGIADSTLLTSSFQEFTASIGTGSSADIRITFNNLDAGDEDIALDNIRIIDSYVPTPTLALTDAPASGGTLTTTPEAATTATIDFTTTNFTVAVPSAGDGYIKWNVKDVGDNIIDSGDIFTTDGTETPVTGLVAGNTYTLFAELVDNLGAPISPAVEYTLTVIIPTYTVVTDIAALRADVTTNGVGGYYEITGAVLVTHTDGFNDRQWIQDSNVAGILITEEGAEADIPFYNVGDNVTGLKGGTDESNGLLRFLPSTDSGVVASSGNSVTPQLVTISDFNTNYADYESELVELQNVTFDAADGVATFSTGTNYNVSDAIPNTVVMRTDYFGADYIGTVIPSNNITSLVAIAGRFNTTGQIYARSLSDFTLNSKYIEIEGFKMYPNPTSLGYINILSRSNSKMDVSVYSILGRQIINETVNNNRLDVSSLNSGVYIMKVSQDDAITTTKLVVR